MEKKMEEYAIIDDYLCIRMPQEVDHHGAAGIRECADRLILDDKVKNIVFDFADTTLWTARGWVSSSADIERFPALAERCMRST